MSSNMSCHEIDSDEEIPLKILATKKDEPLSHSIPYGTLCQRETLNCEFCEKIFHNRYNAITHNSKHIIIPLLKLSLLQCEICLYFFTSSKEFDDHLSEKHPERLKRQKTNHIISKLVFEDDISSDDNDDNDDDDEMPKGDTDSVLMDKVDIDHRIIEKIDLSDEEPVYENGFDSENEYESIHYNCVMYDKLIKPGFFKCKYCKKTFANRYDALRHNATHIKIQQSSYHLCCRCEKFFETASVLATHVEITHRLVRQSHDHETCGKCQLPYHSIGKHYELYHNFDCYKVLDRSELVNHIQKHEQKISCKICGIVTTLYDLESHIKEHIIMKICNFCEFYSRDLPTFFYRHLEKYDMGIETACDQCTLSFTSLNIVEKVFTGNTSGLKMKHHSKHACKKTITNEVRLKNIQNRLKSLKR